MSETIGLFHYEQGDIEPVQISRLRHIAHHFDQEYLRSIVRPLIEEGSPVSLRVVDWAAVNYSKQFPVFYLVEDWNGNEFKEETKNY